MTQKKQIPIEEMDLEALRDNVTELSDEELLAFLSGTRNNRLKTSPKKKKKKKKDEPEDQLVTILREMGPGAMEALAKMMEDME